MSKDLLVGELMPTWLSEIIRVARKIERILPLMERLAERDAIVAAIETHPDGEKFARHKNLPEVVYAALGVANDVERRMKANPSLCGPSPHSAAARFIAEELGESLD